MNNVGVVAVRDYLSNVANEKELREFKELIVKREEELKELFARELLLATEGCQGGPRTLKRT